VSIARHERDCDGPGPLLIEAIGSPYPLGIGLGSQAMGNLLFWLGIGAAQKGAGSKPMEPRHGALSFVVGTLVALLIAAGMFLLLVSHQQ
jgi:hypothetical protein